MKFLTKKFFDRLGKKAFKMYKAWIWSKQMDVKGNKFIRYKEPYGSLKRANKLKRQSAASSASRAPILTGDFKNDLIFKGASTNGFTFSWNSRGARVNHLADMKRVVTSKDTPLPRDVTMEIDRQVLREIKRKQGKSKTHKIVLGK